MPRSTPSLKFKWHSNEENTPLYDFCVTFQPLDQPLHKQRGNATYNTWRLATDWNNLINNFSQPSHYNHPIVLLMKLTTLSTSISHPIIWHFITAIARIVLFYKEEKLYDQYRHLLKLKLLSMSNMLVQFKNWNVYFVCRD